MTSSRQPRELQRQQREEESDTEYLSVQGQLHNDDATYPGAYPPEGPSYGDSEAWQQPQPQSQPQLYEPMKMAVGGHRVRQQRKHC